MNRKQRKLGTADSRMFRSFLEILEQSRPSWINPECSRMFRSILARSQVGGDGEAIRGGIIVQEGRFWNGLERSGTFSKGGVLRVDRCLLEREESRVSAESAPSQRRVSPEAAKASPVSATRRMYFRGIPFCSVSLA